ncbi:MAG: hypothetical protein GX419_10160 [Bacteroidales bacterium]|nr:hypothetical protein [Bacteroidales bacterium]
MDTPDFSQPEMVLSGKRPSRPVLFAFFLNDKLYHHLTGKQMENCSTNEENIVVVIEAFRNTGYDYVTLTCRNRNTLKFERGEKHKEESISLIVYEQYSSRISLPGGIDMDFLVRAYPAEIRARAVNLLKRTAARVDMPWAPVTAFPNTCPLRTILR